MYIHYWYADYVAKSQGEISTMYTHLANAKNRIFSSHGMAMQNFKHKAQFMNKDASFDEFNAIINFMSNDNSQERKQIFENQKVDNISWSQKMKDIQQSIIGERAGSTVTDIELAEMIDTFLAELNNVMEQVYKQISSQGTWQSFQAQVIDLYANKTKIPQSKMADRIINDFLQHEGLKKLGLNTGVSKEITLNTSLQNIALLCESLPEYGTDGTKTLGSRRYSTGSTQGKYKISGSGINTLGIIRGKLQGLFNNVVGKAGEVAWAEAEKSAEKGLNKALKETNASLSRLGYKITTSVIGENLSKSTFGKNNGVSKPDVSVRITEATVNGQPGKLLVEYGASVKTYTLSPSDSSKKIGVISGTSFWDAVLTAYGHDQNGLRYLFNLAGGHPGRGALKTKQYSATDLNSKWQQYVNYVTAHNFINFLLGVVQREGVNNLYLVVNGNIWTVPDIVNALFNENAEIIAKAVNKNNNRMVSRNKLSELNKWVYFNNVNNGKRKNVVKDYNAWANENMEGARRDEPMLRSVEAESAILNALQSFRLNVDLKVLASAAGLT